MSVDVRLGQAPQERGERPDGRVEEEAGARTRRTDSARRVEAVDRALQALEELADTPGGLGVTELGRRLGIDKSTAHRLLGTLLARGFVRVLPQTQRYALGLRLAGLGAAAVRGVDLSDVARPHLEALRDRTAEAATLAVLFEGEVLVLARATSTGALTVSHGVGSRLAAHSSALGKVLMAGADDPETVPRVIAQRGLPRQTEHTLVRSDALLAHLDVVRQQGWAIDDEETALGLRCLAAPVRDASGANVAAIGISGPTSRVTTALVPALSGVVRGAAVALSTALGYRPRPATAPGAAPLRWR